VGCPAAAARRPASLFPTFALIALPIVGAKGDTPKFREVRLGGAKRFPPFWLLSRPAFSWLVASTTASRVLAASPPGCW
jgi:uncharacterized membrane protein (GlpM family)